MKTRGIVPLLLALAVVHAPAQQTVSDWQREATKAYPALATKDSDLNHLFVSEYSRLKQENPAFFSDPQWPLVLARQCAEKLKPEVAAISPAPAEAGQPDVPYIIARAQQAYLAGDYDTAKGLFNQVLQLDPHNTLAIEFLHQIRNRKVTAASPAPVKAGQSGAIPASNSIVSASGQASADPTTAEIHGRVCDEEGNPIVNARVGLTANINSIIRKTGTGYTFTPAQAWTDAKGQFAIITFHVADFDHIGVEPPHGFEMQEKTNSKRLALKNGDTAEVNFTVFASKAVTIDFVYQPDGTRSFTSGIKTGTITCEPPNFGFGVRRWNSKRRCPAGRLAVESSKWRVGFLGGLIL